MASIQKPAKRAKTIDAFFAAKSSKSGAGGTARVTIEVRCMASEADVTGPDAAEPLAQQQQQQKQTADAAGAAPAGAAVASGEAAAVDGAAASVSPRKRRASSGGNQAAPRSPGGRQVGGGGDTAAAEAQAETGQQGAAGGAAVSAAAADAGAATAAGTGAGAEEQQRQQQQQQSAEVDDGLTPAQRAQIAANRNRALARRAVAAAAQPGAPPLRLASLLVEPSWRQALAPQLGLAADGVSAAAAGKGAAANVPGSLAALEPFLAAEWGPGRKKVFPPQADIFAAFNACPFDQVRVVILGQDPYHGEGQAMGLSFSVPRDCRPLPPSLLNIYKEAQSDLGWADRPAHGDLTSWSVQGVLLLNTCLTVRQGEANSHAKRGWEAFTDAAIKALSARRRGLVFLLWGKPAQTKAALVDRSKHHVLESAHPSPLSASRGFFGCRHFSQANQLLAAQGLAPIDWRPQ